MNEPVRVLLPNTFEPLQLGRIRPHGWLLKQLRLQAAGLGGFLDQIWPDVADSAWIGGAAEGWERGPYWLDGFVPLAFVLGDERLIATARRWIDAILERQAADGWLGPVQDTVDERRRKYDPWPVFVALKAMTQFQDATGDARIIPAMQRFLRCLDALLDRQPLFDWARYRWAELAVSLYWLYRRTGEHWLLDLAAKTYRQSFDWRGHLADFQLTQKQPIERIHPPVADDPHNFTRTNLASHVVNNAMALKQPALWFRLSHDNADRTAGVALIETLDRYHGQATGVFTGDEHLAGLSPSQGTELCAVVEYLFSLEMLVSTLGDPALADRLERIAFNALPAAFSEDMWAHQYVQQANQVVCAISDDRVYTNNGPDANIFGLEPNYGCCTANFQQGWPKFAAHLWMRSQDGGLAAVAYAPCQVSTSINGQPLRLDVRTEYPFDDQVRIAVLTPAPHRFALHLRIPGWALGATVALDGGRPVPVDAGTFFPVDRVWRAGSEVLLRFPMHAAMGQRPGGSVALERGPLVYALAVDAQWRPVTPHNRSAPTTDERIAVDYEVYPTSGWNYALALDPARPDHGVTFEKLRVGNAVFSVAGAPIVARVPGRRLPAWRIEHGAAAPVPHSPARSDQPLQALTLLPYGCTTLRITEFPYTLG